MCMATDKQIIIDARRVVAARGFDYGEVAVNSVQCHQAIQ